MKKRFHEEHTNHERWAIPYADLMTLLLAFFVVMYALSAVNVSKYKVLAQSINQAFNGNGKVIRPLNGSRTPHDGPLPDPSRVLAGRPIALVKVPVPPPDAPPPGKEGAAAASAGNNPDSATLDHIAASVKSATKPLIANHQIALHRTKYWLEIEIRTDILFASGMARLQPTAMPILSRVAAVLAPYHNPLRIEGYTDNRPINTRAFPSNWELSAARAATVARLFSDHGVDPDRLGILGWSQYRPVASNATAAGRNRNRRVTILVLSDRGVPARFYSDARRVPDAGNGGGAQKGTPAPLQK